MPSLFSSPFGIAFDIDGVILRGTVPIGNSGRALRRLYDDSVVAVQSSGGSMPSAQASGGVRRSSASMLSGTKPVTAAPATRKPTSGLSGTNKKGDGKGQSRVSKPIEVEDVEPGEMSLEEIENRLGSLIQADTIAQLKSVVWKERLEAIMSFKEQVEALTDIDSSVEVLVYLLCVVPGWNEKNVQVQQQILETMTHIASTASKFPKKCVVLCLVLMKGLLTSKLVLSL